MGLPTGFRGDIDAVRARFPPALAFRGPVEQGEALVNRKTRPLVHSGSDHTNRVTGREEVKVVARPNGVPVGDHLGNGQL
jgi:hypothetical protein